MRLYLKGNIFGLFSIRPKQYSVSTLILDSSPVMPVLINRLGSNMVHPYSIILTKINKVVLMPKCDQTVSNTETCELIKCQPHRHELPRHQQMFPFNTRIAQEIILTP